MASFPLIGLSQTLYAQRWPNYSSGMLLISLRIWQVLELAQIANNASSSNTGNNSSNSDGDGDGDGDCESDMNFMEFS